MRRAGGAVTTRALLCRRALRTAHADRPGRPPPPHVLLQNLMPLPAHLCPVPLPTAKGCIVMAYVDAASIITYRSGLYVVIAYEVIPYIATAYIVMAYVVMVDLLGALPPTLCAAPRGGHAAQSSPPPPSAPPSTSTDRARRMQARWCSLATLCAQSHLL